MEQQLKKENIDAHTKTIHIDKEKQINWKQQPKNRNKNAEFFFFLFFFVFFC